MVEITADLIKTLQDGLNMYSTRSQEDAVVVKGEPIGPLYAEALTAALQLVKVEAERQAVPQGGGSLY